jgi:glutathione S-transferase
LKAAFNPDYKTALTAAGAADAKIATKLNHLKHALGDGHYLVGGHLTIADIFAAYSSFFLNHIFSSAEVESPTANHATLNAHENNVWSQPELVEYIASDHWKKPVFPPTMLPWLKY